MTTRVAASHLFADAERGVLADVALEHAAGRITGLEAGQPVAGPRRFVVPALVNAHDHGRPAMASFGAGGMPLETWIARSAFGAPPEPYLATAVPLARAARAGCGAMMIHYTRPSGTMALVDEARAIARAAGDVGIRLAFALAVRDRNPLVYGDGAAVLAQLPAEGRRAVEELFVRPAMAPRAYVELVDAIAAAIAGPTVDVQFGPAGVQWCSPPMLEAIAAHSARTGRRVHMHLLETVYQRAWADRTFPGGIVAYLRDIGLLSERLTLAHCTHARPDELDLIAAAGATIVTNFSSNLHLRSGLAPIAEAHRRGCRIAVGIDGVALDEDDDAIREMRLVQLVHDGVGFGRTWSPAEFLALALRDGRRAVGAPGDGRLVPGAPADFAVLDLDRLDRDAIMPVDPLDLMFARGNTSCVRDVVVDGRTIVRDGRPTGIDLAAAEAELRARFRAALPRYAALERHWRPFDAALTEWFRSYCGCA
ncbi:amidohydrolase family protein [Chelatococcus reniformis]|uniref:5-methylthioadenosine/S-adenosylhomocysteine deaminase n=1 Tax=Chelatococcus reniformis TaxID=1494448 RepID=A0A916UNX7_9HYPH|nr:amidohydrolase family protein [Chelatococcus reniformis]GGC79555.1 5-methylthioadenosine/S-adenosylhomocysteine deaminase [Chelatococcus reniformis]